MSNEHDFVDSDDETLEQVAQETYDKADADVMRVLSTRQFAYRRVFHDGAASARDVEIVMLDLARFCRAFKSTFDPNEQQAARLDGRREVYLRIMEYSRLPLDALFEKYHRGAR